MDEIALEAGVAKMTLYRHFQSKDELILAHLKRSADEYWEWFDDALSNATSADKKLITLFASLEDRCRSAQYLGCTFQAAAVEFPDRAHPVNSFIRAHKNKVRDRLEKLSDEAGVDDPDSTANQLVLIMEGSLASVRYLTLPVPAREAADAVKRLLA